MPAKKKSEIFKTTGLAAEKIMDLTKIGGRKVPFNIRRIAGKNPHVLIPHSEINEKTGKIAELPISAASGKKSKSVMGKNFRVFGISDGKKRIVVKIPWSPRYKKEYFTPEGLKWDVLHYSKISRGTNTAKYKKTEWLPDFKFMELPPEEGEMIPVPARYMGLPKEAKGIRLDYFELKGEKNLAEHTFRNPKRLGEAMMKMAGDATHFFQNLHMVLDTKAENYSNYMPKGGKAFPLIDMDSFSNRPRGTLLNHKNLVMKNTEEAEFVGGRIGMTLVDLGNTNHHLLKPGERILREIKNGLASHISGTITQHSERKSMIEALDKGIEWELHKIAEKGYAFEAKKIKKSLGI